MRNVVAFAATRAAFLGAGPDGLHMNDDGYKIWNEIVGAVLRKP
jgi:lysophospholipase L1-like esterase